MAATDHLRRWAVPGALVVVLVGAVLVGFGRSGPSSLGPLPPTSRDDVSLTVDVERTGPGLVELSFVVEVAAGAGEPLVLTDFSAEDGWTPLMDADPTARRAEPDLHAAVHGDRPRTGPVTFHLGGSSIVGGGSVDYQEPPEARERSIGPGESVEGRAAFSAEMAMALAGHTPVEVADLDVDAVRVCLWEAGVEPGPDTRPVACADDGI